MIERSRKAWWCCAAGLAVLLWADDAWAWGPAVHVGLARSVLEQLGLLPAAVAAILARHGLAFLYGNIAADVVFAKRLSRVKQFCHHWSTAFRLLEVSRDDSSRAFAYGYLSHLAADTVAHGKYVPRQIILSNCAVSFGHLYWELRADGTQPSDTWHALKDLLDEDHACHHRALAEQIRDTFLSYRLNRLLFDGMNALTVHRSFRKTLAACNRRSRWHLPPELVRDYQAECLDRTFSILSAGPRSALLHEDPNGTSALMNLREHNRQVKRLRRRGLPVSRRVAEASQGLAPPPFAAGRAHRAARTEAALPSSAASYGAVASAGSAETIACASLQSANS